MQMASVEHFSVLALDSLTQCLIFSGSRLLTAVGSHMHTLQSQKHDRVASHVSN